MIANERVLSGATPVRTIATLGASPAGAIQDSKA